MRRAGRHRGTARADAQGRRLRLLPRLDDRRALAGLAIAATAAVALTGCVQSANASSDADQKNGTTSLTVFISGPAVDGVEGGLHGLPLAGGEPLDEAALAHDFTQAVSDELVPRAMRALELTGRRTLVAAGGVAANSLIRADLQAACEKAGVKLYLPPLKWCGDNGAMIGAQGYYEYRGGRTAGLDLNAYATMDLGDPVF